ncbi:hypothetical protein PSTEL_22120 [Paenibacillus stellifer]|uniref:Uncharacterized protein n=1 Tax=Paenibacillus stellifer TaxID=169760 RepID=A0A089LZ88_9BACL|nr:hypothetical protein PSTEL_22120 [Paenibacillus stellifer]
MDQQADSRVDKLYALPKVLNRFIAVFDVTELYLALFPAWTLGCNSDIYGIIFTDRCLNSLTITIITNFMYDYTYYCRISQICVFIGEFNPVLIVNVQHNCSSHTHSIKME